MIVCKIPSNLDIDQKVEFALAQPLIGSKGDVNKAISLIQSLNNNNKLENVIKDFLATKNYFPLEAKWWINTFTDE